MVFNLDDMPSKCPHSPAMLWSDYGMLWQIDHIVPFCEYVDGKPPTKEVKLQRMHHSNLQPIWIWAHKEKSAQELIRLAGHKRKIYQVE